MSIRFGFCVPNFAGAADSHPRTPLVERFDHAQMVAAVREAESLGYDSIWVADHLMLGRDDAVLEGWTTLSYLAGVTSRLRLGTIHLANAFRHPSITAKMAASLDAISGGRLEFFFEPGHKGSIREAQSYGYGWEDDATRRDRFLEAVAVIRAMWTQDHPSFHGRFYQVENAICYPRPIQRPVPLWIGTIGGEVLSENVGMNELMADVIAREADWWNNTPASVAYCRQMIDMLRSACLRAGRDFRSIGLSLETQVLVAESEAQVRRVQAEIERLNPRRAFYSDWASLSERYIMGDPAQVAARLRQYVDLGISYFLLWFMDYPSLDGLRLFARRIIPSFR